MIATGTPIRVLLVEDNPGDAKIIAEIFRDLDHPFRLKTAGTLADGGRAFTEEKADIVLLDLNLPDSFGPATLTKAEALFAGRPIIVLTGFYEEQLGLDLIKKGAQDYLVKGKITGDWLAYSIQYSIERDRIEQKLKARETRLRDILEKSPDGFVVTDKNGTVLFTNHGAELIYGRERSELLQQPLGFEAYTEKTVETRLTRADGRELPLEIRAVEIPWGAENCRLVIMRDLTAVRALETSRDEFISMVSHELRSPLTVIKESLQLVYDGVLGGVTEKQKEMIKIGLENTGRLNNLVDELLDITKMEAGVMPLEITCSDTGALLRGTAVEYSHIAGDAGIKIETVTPDTALETYFDLEKIREVLVNLVSNAIKFTPRGGSIKLSLGRVEDEAVISVEDSGPGIAPDELPRLFNKFAQAGRGRPAGIKGTGLGLAISKGIVEMHHGRIWAESEPGKGCRFSFTLPLQSFEGAAQDLVRREIDRSAARKSKFCSLTLALPGGNGGPAPDTADRVADFLRESLRSSRGMIRRPCGEFTLLLHDTDAGEACKACSYIEKNLPGLAGDWTGGRPQKSFILSYPEDFNDEASFIKKLGEARTEQ